MKKIFIILSCFLILSCHKSQNTLFTSIPTKESGVVFSNDIVPTNDLNILTHPYLYHGGGVAIADFNNDELPDLYFTGNLVDNALYLNKTCPNCSEDNLVFEDVTKQSRVGASDIWSSGAIVVDINNDGWLDIYVAATNSDEASERQNALFVNQGTTLEGIPFFREMAHEYGLADTSYTTMATFFDYDNDGDLDVFMTVNNPKHLEKTTDYRKKITDGTSPQTDKLYRNDLKFNEFGLIETGFVDVSNEAGILIEGYSLGVNIVDINQDGWKDIYVTNDNLTNDILYINQKNGTFRNDATAYLKHTSYSATGIDINDIDNDGLADIFTVDRLPTTNYYRKTLLPPNDNTKPINNKRFEYEPQFIRNTLQINQGNIPYKNHPIFSEVALISGIAATDWSWSALMADIDNDGLKDILVTNGTPGTTSDYDFQDLQHAATTPLSYEVVALDIPKLYLPNVIFQNQGNLNFKDVSAMWGFRQAYFSNGAAYGDLDLDGDLDYVTNNIDQPASIFRNDTKRKKSNYLRVKFKGSAKNTMAQGVVVKIEYGNGKQQVYENTIYRGYLSSVENIAHFGLGKIKKIDKLTIIWEEGKEESLINIDANQTITVDYDNAKAFAKGANINNFQLFDDISEKIDFKYKHEDASFVDFNIQHLLPHKLSNYGPGLAVVDVNSDSLDDVYISGARHQKGFFLVQQLDGRFERMDLLPDRNTYPEEELGSLFFDADNDGDVDLYIVSGGYESSIQDTVYKDQFFINENDSFYLADSAIPSFLSSGSCVRACDFDKDGDLDLFVGGRVLPGEYPKSVNSYILKNISNDSAVLFVDATEEVAPQLQNIGMVSDALWTDVDNNGWRDLMIVGEWMPITIFKNNGKKRLKHTEIANTSGWWNSINAGDFDNDGDTDYILGNLGLNTSYKASKKYPLKIYADDFDKNGSYDILPSIFFKIDNGLKKEVPYNGRVDVLREMNFIKDKYPQYATFAKAGVKDIINKKGTRATIRKKAIRMESVYLKNKGYDNFDINPLPNAAQVSPIFGTLIDDYNGDGYLDILIVGNDYGAEVFVGQYDGMNGLLLLGDGKDGFESLNHKESGIFAPYNAKSIVKLASAKGNYRVIIGQNNDEFLIFQSKIKPKITPITTENYAIVTENNGSKRKVEFYYGSGFLGQSTRKLFIHSNFQAVTLEE